MYGCEILTRYWLVPASYQFCANKVLTRCTISLYEQDIHFVGRRHLQDINLCKKNIYITSCRVHYSPWDYKALCKLDTVTKPNNMRLPSLCCHCLYLQWNLCSMFEDIWSDSCAVTWLSLMSKCFTLILSLFFFFNMTIYPFLHPWTHVRVYCLFLIPMHSHESTPKYCVYSFITLFYFILFCSLREA